MTEKIDSKVTYFLVGMGVGSLLGILFAPKSGEETREYLSQKVNERERVRPEESAGTEGAG
jgi:gas vesicle protein